MKHYQVTFYNPEYSSFDYREFSDFSYALEFYLDMCNSYKIVNLAFFKGGAV